MDKVSIIIPYKTDRGFLSHAIESVNKQTYKGEIELILSKSNNGVSYNLNRGIEKATGTFIKYLCDDDWLTFDSIERSVEAMHQYDFVHGCAYNVQNNNYSIHKPAVKNPTMNDLLYNNHIHGGTLMYRREVFDKVGLFDESLDCAEEYEFNLRCLSNGLKIGYCPSILYYYRRHPAQKSLGKGVNQAVRMAKVKAIKARFK